MKVIERMNEQLNDTSQNDCADFKAPNSGMELKDQDAMAEMKTCLQMTQSDDY